MFVIFLIIKIFKNYLVDYQEMLNPDYKFNIDLKLILEEK